MRAISNLAALVVAGGVVMSLGCSSATPRSGDAGDGGTDEDSDLDRSDADESADDARSDADEEIPSGTPFDGTGWQIVSGDQHLFVPEEAVEVEARASCEMLPGVYDEADAFWVREGPTEHLLRYADSIPNEDRIGLVSVSGYLSEPGAYGPDEQYERELTIVSAALLTCETGRVSGHCLLPPRFEVCCFFDGDGLGPDGDVSSWGMTYSTPPDDVLIFHPSVTVGEAHISADLPIPLELLSTLETVFVESPAEFEVEDFRLEEYTGGTVSTRRFTEELMGWYAFEPGEIPFEDCPLEYISVSGRRPSTGEFLHLWGEFSWCIEGDDG